MPRGDETTINVPRGLHQRWKRLRGKLGLNNTRLIEVLLDRWDTSSADERGKSLVPRSQRRERREVLA